MSDDETVVPPTPKVVEGAADSRKFFIFSQLESSQPGREERRERPESRGHTLGLGGEGRRTDRGISALKHGWRGSCLVQSMGVPPGDRGGVPLGISEPQTSMRLHGLRVEEYETVG